MVVARGIVAHNAVGMCVVVAVDVLVSPKAVPTDESHCVIV